MYNEKVLDHFQNPRNVGEMENPSGVGEVGNMKCGDIMKIFIKVEDNIIKDIKFLTFGCGAAIASSSVLTEMVKGKTLEEALAVTNDDVAEELGGLPPPRCTAPTWLPMPCIKPLKTTRAGLEVFEINATIANNIKEPRLRRWRCRYHKVRRSGRKNI